MMDLKVRASAAKEAQNELKRRLLGDFIEGYEPQYDRAPHTRLLCEHLEALERRSITRLIVCLPPRHGKSMHAAQAFPAWYLGRNPSHQVILASYAAELAESHSRRARAIVRDERFPFPVSIAESSSAVNRWQTSVGGIVIAAGVGGGLTGFGGDLLVIDDAIGSREEADSETARNRIWSWYAEVARTRLMRDGVILIAATRWHDDDIVGRILASADAPNWTVLALPALAENDDLLGRKPGEALWPAWYPAKDYPSVERGEITSRAFSALYQQSPAPDDGTIFRADWFKTRYQQAPKRLAIVQALDGAWKTGIGNDFSVIATWATDGRSYFLLDIWRGRLEFPELVQKVVERYRQFRPRLVIAEEAASGLAILAELRRNSSIPITGVVPRGGKVSRAEAITPLFESGRVQLPASAPWLEEFIAEHLRFPAGKHDDQVDTTSLALPHLSKIVQAAAYRARSRDDFPLGHFMAR